MIIEEKKLYDFLDDASRHELHFSRDRQNCLLIKSAFDAETDFLYLLEGYYENDPHKTGDSAAYAGVYSHVRREYFDIPYVLHDRPDENKSIEELLSAYENKLESVYRCNKENPKTEMQTFSYTAENRVSPAVKTAKPKVLIPVFPGTNCEYDSAKAMRDAGAEPEIFVINNRSAENVAKSVEDFANSLKTAQMVFIPGGFSGGDEPDGSGKFITAFFRNAAVKEQVADLLDNRDGLMCGICNGFQALIKLGLVPYGKIIDTDENCPTLTYNTIARHQSKIVRTRIASNKSPWLADTEVGDIYSVPISHGEGRFIASDELILRLAENGQIATQYVDENGQAASDIHFNPNGSYYAIEGITSPDGRVFGKMGHSERYAADLYKNVPGNYDIKMFRSAVKYFK